MAAATRDSARTRKRVRLAPQARAERILDAALVEFARHGFASARIEDIARGAGLVKSGFYAHFRSKEEIFEALLTRHLATGVVVPFGESDTVSTFVDRFIDSCYSQLADPRRQAILRLLLTEAHRIPELLGQWLREVARPVTDAQVKVLRAAVSRGQLAPGPILGNFSFAYLPVLWVLAIGPLADSDGTGVPDLALHREMHRQMLLSLLQPPARAGKAPRAGRTRPA